MYVYILLSIHYRHLIVWRVISQSFYSRVMISKKNYYVKKYNNMIPNCVLETNLKLSKCSKMLFLKILYLNYFDNIFYKYIIILFDSYFLIHTITNNMNS